MTNATQLAHQLTRWAHGVPAHEAAVRIMLDTLDGALVDPSAPWVNVDRDDRATLDFDLLASVPEHRWSDREHAVVAIVLSLADGAPVNLGNTLAELDRWDSTDVAAVLTAFWIAAGNHQPAPTAAPR